MSIIGGVTGIANTETWTESARCSEIGPNDNLWFPDKWARSTEAKRICNGCPVQQACLEYAMTTGQRYGVWGGLNTKQRDDLRRTRAPRTFHREGCPCSICVRRRTA